MTYSPSNTLFNLLNAIGIDLFLTGRKVEYLDVRVFIRQNSQTPYMCHIKPQKIPMNGLL